MSIRTLFETCQPRADVLNGTTRDEQFAADLAQVINGKAPAEYGDAATFFRNTYPTRGIKDLLKAVCTRLSGKGGEVSSIIRLHTQFGGGKTHGLIALVHAVRGAGEVPNISDFLDRTLLPTRPVRVAALDGENTDPANGRLLEHGLRAKSLWGELAYQLAGRKGFEIVRESDERHIAPGAETLRELLGDQPALILIDEVSVYLRKVEAAQPGASKQFAAFVQALFKTVSSSPNAALVYTLAVGKDALAGKDAYTEENERAAAAMEEAARVAARNSTQINPTDEDETADVLRTRLFDNVDLSAVSEIVDAYADVWLKNRDILPDDVNSPALKEQFRKTWPLHPKTMQLLTEKTSSLSTFQRTRGMLRLLVRTVHWLWRQKPDGVYAIHPHSIDPAFLSIRDEITVKLGQDQYIAALKADVASVGNEEPALAQKLDQQKFPGLAPVTSYVANTIFLHTLAYGEAAQGITAEQLKIEVCSPVLEPAFIEQARVGFVAESIYLDDRPGAPLRFMAEPNLTMMIRKQMADIHVDRVNEKLQASIDLVFKNERSAFRIVLFPRGSYEVPDDVSDDRPLLVIMNWKDVAIPADLRELAWEFGQIFQYKGANESPREYRNNLVFVAADLRDLPRMQEAGRRHLALSELKLPENQRGLADHQKKRIEKDLGDLDLNMSILQCYRHLFYPSGSPMIGTSLPIGHTVMELTGVRKFPGQGSGQMLVNDILSAQGKLMDTKDEPDKPEFVRDQTPLRLKGEISTLDLRNEYRKAPKLAILLDDVPLQLCIRKGIKEGVFLYREGTQVWGPGDSGPGSIPMATDSFVLTMEEAKVRQLWPRAEPLVVGLESSLSNVVQGGYAKLTLTISGGIGPYKILCSEPTLSTDETLETLLTARVRPDGSSIYKAEVTDQRGTRMEKTVTVSVSDADGVKQQPVLIAVKPSERAASSPPAPTDLRKNGPLKQALSDLWAQAREAKFVSISKLIIRMQDASATWKLHQAVAVLKGAEVRCELNVAIESDGVEEFTVRFLGTVEKANSVKGYLEPLIRTASDSDFSAVYTMAFTPPLPLKDDSAENVTRDLVRFGGGEAYVEAQAARAGSV